MTAEPPRPNIVRLYESQPLRFVVVGGFNTILCYAIYALLVSAGLRFWVANLIALLFGIGVSFFTQGRIVFGNRNPRLIFRFATIWLCIYLIQTGLIALLMRASVDPRLAGLIVLPATVIVSFLTQKLIVFKPAVTRVSGNLA
jgi:putative flippase GtrA